MMAHTYNPSYLGSRYKEVHGSKPAWAKKFMRVPFQPISLAWWYMPMIPALQKAQVRGPWLPVSSGQKCEILS
jgi:hypothetical protein